MLPLAANPSRNPSQTDLLAQLDSHQNGSLSAHGRRGGVPPRPYNYPRSYNPTKRQAETDKKTKTTQDRQTDRMADNSTPPFINRGGAGGKIPKTFAESGGDRTFKVDENTTDASLLHDCIEESWKESRVGLFKDAVPRCTHSALAEFKSLIPETIRKKKKALGDMGFIYSPCIITDKTDKTLDVLERDSSAIVQSAKMVRFFANHGLKPVAVGVRELTGILPSDPTNKILTHTMYVCLVSIKFADEVLSPLYWRAVHKEEEKAALRVAEEMKKRSQSNAPSTD